MDLVYNYFFAPFRFSVGPLRKWLTDHTKNGVFVCVCVCTCLYNAYMQSTLVNTHPFISHLRSFHACVWHMSYNNMYAAFFHRSPSSSSSSSPQLCPGLYAVRVCCVDGLMVRLYCVFLCAVHLFRYDSVLLRAYKLFRVVHLSRHRTVGTIQYTVRWTHDDCAELLRDRRAAMMMKVRTQAIGTGQRITNQNM